MSTVDGEVTRRVAIMRELLELTNQMLSNRGNVEAIIIAIEQRQALIEEYDLIKSVEGYETPLSEVEAAEIKSIARQILDKDKVVNELLAQYHKEAKQDVSSTARQQKVLGYVSNTIASSGSFMDFKK